MNINYEHIQRLVDRIEGHLAEEVNVLTLADSFHMSPWHFQRTFKSLIGDTLGSYIRGRRLTHAAQILLGTDKSIIEIAFEVGFNSHEAFSRSFKSCFSLTPKAFRQERPEILFNEKPLLTEDLFEHLAEGMNQEPAIVDMPGHFLAGYSAPIPSPFVSNEDYCDTLYEPWMKLLEHEKSLPDRIEGQYAGLMLSESGNFTEQNLHYLAGASVSKLSDAPTEMQQHTFPKQKVAMFEIFAGTENNLAKTVDYIYGYWLPNSRYTRGNGNDYELFENVVSFEDPKLKSKYVLPVMEA